MCVQHYISYNADTRLLNLYPNVLVLEDADVAEPAVFVKVLQAEYGIRIVDDVQLVRQVYVNVCPAATKLPHLCSKWLQKAVHRLGQ